MASKKAESSDKSKAKVGKPKTKTPTTKNENNQSKKQSISKRTETKSEAEARGAKDLHSDTMDRLNKKHIAKVIEKEGLSKEIHFKENATLKKQDAETRMNEEIARDIANRVARVKTKESNKVVDMIGLISLIIFSSLLVTISLDIFTKPSELFGAGLRGITQTIFYSIFEQAERTEYSWVSHLLFFGANIPLVIFGWYKIGKRFTIITVVFLILVFGWSFITPLVFPRLDPFGYSLVDDLPEEIENIVPYIGAGLGGMAYGVGLGLIFKAGGSNGGMKFPIAYFALKKGMSIGKLSKMFGVFVIIQGFIVKRIILDGGHPLEVFSSAQFFSTFILLFVSTTVFDKVFPKNKMVKIQITTSRPRSIIEYFKKIDYNRSFMEFKGYGGFQQKKRTMIEFVVTQFEVKKYTKIARTIDHNCFVSLQEIDGVEGKFKVSGYK